MVTLKYDRRLLTKCCPDKLGLPITQGVFPEEFANAVYQLSACAVPGLPETANENVYFSSV